MSRYNPVHEQKIHVYLYQEDKYPPGTLLSIWQRMVEEHMPASLWADGKICSLLEWVRYFGPDTGRVLFLPFYHEEEQQLELSMLIGAMWIDEIHGHRARGHFMFFRNNGYGEGKPLISIHKGLDLVFALFPQLSLILCQAHASNALALRIWRQLGVYILSEELPGFYQHADGTAHAARIGYLTRAEYAVTAQKVSEYRMLVASRQGEQTYAAFQ